MQYEMTIRETREKAKAAWLLFAGEKTAGHASRALLAALEAALHEDACDRDDEEQRAVAEGVALWLEGR